MTEPIRIFYSWQSDREANVCGRFIQLALKSAIEALQPGFPAELILDSDTAGVAGTPPVSETILRKIRECDVFVGDVSFVGETAAGKRLPNPNVMTEFGYARHVLDDQQIMLVMNTAFGPERDLPLDLAYLRHPLAYQLAEGAPDSERRTKRSAFGKKITGPLEASIKVVIARRARQSVPADVLAPANELFSRAEQLYGRGDVPAIVNGPRLLLRMVSTAAAGEPYLEPAKVKAARPLLMPQGYDRCHDAVGPNQWSAFDPPMVRGNGPNPEARWYTRLIRPGVLETAIMIGARIDDDRTIMVEGFPLEGRMVEISRRFTQVFDQIGLSGPVAINASLLGLEDVQFSTSRWASRPMKIPGLFLGNVGAASSTGVTPQLLRPLMDAFWLGSGFEDGSSSFQNGGWAGDDANVLYEPTTIGGRAWR